MKWGLFRIVLVLQILSELFIQYCQTKAGRPQWAGPLEFTVC